MRMLVTGAGGLLGSNVVTHAQTTGFDAVGTYHAASPDLGIPTRELDIRDKDAFIEVFAEFDPDVVVNCAAMTDVDACENHSRNAMATNGDAPGGLAEACAVRDIGFVQVSTDYVFDGESEDRYQESDTPNPSQVYGRSKLRGERTVRDAHSGATIVRLSFVYGQHRVTNTLDGFPSWVLDRLENGERTPLFTDQYVTPTRAGHAAGTILSLVENDASGTFHVAARECVTPFEFGTAIAEYADVNQSLIERGSLGDVDRPADRPRNTCLCVERVEDKLGRAEPTIADDLDLLREAGYIR